MQNMIPLNTSRNSTLAVAVMDILWELNKIIGHEATTGEIRKTGLIYFSKALLAMFDNDMNRGESAQTRSIHVCQAFCRHHKVAIFIADRKISF